MLIFHEATEEIYYWLENQPNVKEETLTDWMLYYISIMKTNVIYKAFSRREESAAGADWEWWFFTKKNVAYRFLVQAKKLQQDRDNYALLAYSNQNGMQIDLLRQEAKRRRAMPMYAFYTCVQPDFELQTENIAYFKEDILAWCRGCLNGCYLASASDVEKILFDQGKHRVREKEVVNYSFGLSLLDYCWGNTIKAETMLDAISYYCSADYYFEYKIEHIGNEIPKYVEVLMNCRDNRENNGVETEYREQIGNIGGIMIVDLSK